MVSQNNKNKQNLIRIVNDAMCWHNYAENETKTKI